MHFWIDKRSQCTYTGRHRVPSSLSAGRARGRVCMAAPVHRFAAVDCPPPRRPRPSHRNYPPAPIPTVHNPARRQNEDSIYVEIPLEPPHPTIASLAAARSVTPDTLLRTAALGLAHDHSLPMAPHVKFGLMLSFVLVTLFLAASKYYFQGHAVEASSSDYLVLCGVLITMLSYGIYMVCMTHCRTAPPPPLPPERISSTARRERQQPRQQQSQSEPSDDISLTTLLQSAPGDSPEAPPPYKIAVLMPGRPSPPPPAYSELS